MNGVSSVACDAGMFGMRAEDEQGRSRPAKEPTEWVGHAPRLRHSLSVRCDGRHTRNWPQWSQRDADFRRSATKTHEQDFGFCERKLIGQEYKQEDDRNVVREMWQQGLKSMGA